ncbi:hypothetical protein U3653_22070 [Nocardia sp. CDC186]|uniref:Uncharacterized protein n=1 Tax=Nocardia implantans TaxID=3108168 RepID=A0ABU6AZ14_9NOCA|nr:MULTISPECIES: hypothetical protein [unclassified Nocardia]MBF6194187.1 hypothetical protein [Nocardia beijingensis]MEA3529795.1 hypothetical protein [Nocardia sp. CDC192]MEB3512727.1 hypothetical protein [Nocardia sp. CDC186]
MEKSVKSDIELLLSVCRLGCFGITVAIPDEVVLDAVIPIDVFGSDPNYRLEVCAVSPTAPTSVPELSL